ncbi:CTP-transf-1 domain containing protein [Pyrenophora tritici-repentis]|uniref:Phosphatidate cytidylyltransferase n=1 Tax=Pyrenophora tritici-repentis TaxID=45151 RepID=A0A2W1I144_9PLEO|nr:Phosphatidate cytidylyltransferase [Pyrenophora tritici-repentis]KAF7569584.1 phosphatidate cytidylyltransferase 1 [Pyrenophora tritici-repentis]KAI1510301.1 Phosphatidate cytidylyltransferase [Pyrenophora tritici-repentis]KAI1569980.1 Phosphatidate cytidylyltransferase [Pyrenophora tritici-repentis]KAI1668534.1 Phosphatidate cytidylyltransferase [Pyrenophora tritici-repentis]
MARPRKDVKFQHQVRSASNGRARRPSQSMSEFSDPGSPTIKEEAAPPLIEEQPQSEYEKKKANFITRTIWTLVMIGGFFWALGAGHVFIMIAVTAVQVISFKEVIAIANVPSKARSLRFTKSLNWYFLGIAMYFLYGESVIYYFKHILMVDRLLLPLATHHRFISFMLYIIGFVFFVFSLQKGHYKFQFTQFAWTHMALFLIVGQAHFVINNIFEGFIWFILPVSMVVTNDIFAYLCGITFGRTPLIQISPKKTWEGFLGAWFFTVLWGIAITHFLAQYKYFICPVNDLGANIWSGLECRPNPVFVARDYSIPFLPEGLPIPRTFNIMPVQFHVIMLGTFASLIAPFGGFFASGLKRTFKIKDFGDSIPGHGGMTDRMDCQFIMGSIAFFYYSSFIAVHHTTVGGVIEAAITGLTYEEQMEVVKIMSKHLVNQDIISPKVLELLSEQMHNAWPGHGHVRAYRTSDTRFAANDSFFTQPGIASTGFISLGDSPRRPREQLPITQLPTHVLYEHVRAEGAKGHFNDVMNICRILVKDRGEQPNREMYTAILHSFAECTNGTAGKVRKVLEEMGFWIDTDGSVSGRPKIELDARACECVLEVLAVHPDYLLRADILEYMKSRWLALSDRARNFVVAGMLRERHFEHALSALEDMVKNNIRVESWLFEKAMWMLLEFGEAEEAFYVLNLRADAQSRSNATAPSKLSDALWGALLDAAAQANLYHETNMVWTTQVQPGYLKPATGACLSVLTTASRHGDVQLATDVFRVLTERDTTITTHQYEMLINTYLKANDLSAALSVILIMVDANLKVDEGTCHPLYWHLFTQKHGGDSLPMQAFILLQDFEAAGRKVPTAAVNACMQASIALDRLEEAVEMYKALHTVSHAGPNTNTFNILFRGCRRQLRKELAMFFANEMMQLGCKPDRLTYDRLILVCLECGDLDGALLYYEEMTSVNLTGTNKGRMKPRKRTWERLILRSAVQGDERAVGLLKAYKEGVDEPLPSVEKAVIDRVESGLVPIVAATSEDMSSAAVEDQHVRLATGFTRTPGAGADTELSDDSRELDPPGGRS